MASTDIKRFTDQFRQVKQAVEQRMAQSNAALGKAHDNFKSAADNADAFVTAVDSYATELNALANELGTNGGPPLDDTFSSPAAAASGAPDSVPAMIATQESIGRRHPTNQ